MGSRSRSRRRRLSAGTVRSVRGRVNPMVVTNPGGAAANATGPPARNVAVAGTASPHVRLFVLRVPLVLLVLLLLVVLVVVVVSPGVQVHIITRTAVCPVRSHNASARHD